MSPKERRAGRDYNHTYIETNRGDCEMTGLHRNRISEVTVLHLNRVKVGLLQTILDPQGLLKSMVGACFEFNATLESSK